MGNKLRKLRDPFMNRADTPQNDATEGGGSQEQSSHPTKVEHKPNPPTTEQAAKAEQPPNDTEEDAQKITASADKQVYYIVHLISYDVYIEHMHCTLSHYVGNLHLVWQQYRIRDDGPSLCYYYYYLTICRIL